MSTKVLHALCCLVLLAATPVSLAQEPSLELLADGNLIIGIVNLADGSPAAGLSLIMQDTSHAQSAATILQTDASGVFVYAGDALTDYRASMVVEGRTISATISTGEGPAAPFQWPPIYVTLGLLMLLSVIPARLLRRKDL